YWSFRRCKFQTYVPDKNRERAFEICVVLVNLRVRIAVIERSFQPGVIDYGLVQHIVSGKLCQLRRGGVEQEPVPPDVFNLTGKTRCSNDRPLFRVLRRT